MNIIQAIIYSETSILQCFHFFDTTVIHKYRTGLLVIICIYVVVFTAGFLQLIRCESTFDLPMIYEYVIRTEK